MYETFPPLPRNVRQDLELIEVASFEDGSPRWRLYDPVANQFFDLGWLELEILRELRNNPKHVLSSAELAKIIANRANVICNSNQIEEFIEFLDVNGLLWAEGELAQKGRLDLRKSKALDFVQKLVKQFMFLRIPILHPDSMLDRLLPYVGWAFNPAIWWLVLANTIVAVYLTSRQLDYFLNTFISYFKPIGFIYFAIAIILAKILHEFGHALVARKLGCSVRAMGVALLLFWPILYTDTTDAWRLKRRSGRVWIGLAGMMVEMAIASVALLLWNFFPDGVFRTLLFMLATSTWLMTLFVNLNPFMKFDGYYVLSDMTGVENLHERAGAMGKWWLRERIFKYDDPAPEMGKRWLVFFAYATWIYRLLIFTGIFWVLYAYFFKALGIIMAMVQVTRMLILPIGKEVQIWWEKREALDVTRTRWSGAAVLLIAALFATPLDGDLELPAYWQARQVVTLYSPISGVVEAMPESVEALVAMGETVFVIGSPDLRFELEQAKHDVTASRYELRRTGVSSSLAQDRLALQARLSGALKRSTDTRMQLEDAHLRADFDAKLTDVQPDLRAGDWVQKGDRLITLLDQSSGEVVAYLGESDLDLVSPGAAGRFYPYGGTRQPFNVVLEQIDDFALENLEQPYAASTFSGDLDVRDGKDGAIIPQRATYRILLTASEPVRDRILSGVLVLDSESRSFLASVWRRIVGVWRREAGF